ncbi:UDP-N-acetylmuramoyl-L-alanine--D-glutamate ligase [Fibrivirga algicola]|uniref:UDP-N-acetylmuramoylalanine--D-glutamate ligase n=1 Tax=Fibrivirga algicola TaxID=2950420 RepID=A0ABX0QN22_9BACT|nr:UDP-N-acetylmuramoyl-L-alanine--D-glutamate ligase [Fibrivirga algicola]NID11519.1 UDP-N-acetylmuramoyl-L-alanine--D-glutamate ligase [Fibrivirga algicola]
MRLVILGGGESGVGAALLGQAKGYDVFLSDRSPLKATYLDTLREADIPFEEGQHTESLILNATEVVKSPGIPDTVPLILKLKELGIPVISEIEFAARYTTAKLIGITGSNGKTTTTLLTYHLLKTAGLNVGLAGNVGDSFAKQVINDTFDYFVLELSSFQLDSMYNTRLDTAVLLNITPDHLDRYAYDFKNYVASKFRVLQNLRPEDTFIYFRENAPTQQELALRSPNVYTIPISLKTSVTPGGYVQEGRLVAQFRERHFSAETVDLPLKGPHNALNMLAAILAAQSMNVPDNAILEGLRSFKNAAHRMEPAGTINGIRFINDSKATNVDSVFYALSSMDAPTIWIAGGQDKGNEYSQLDEVVGQHVKALICLGKDNKKLVDYFSDKLVTIRETQDVREAVQLALELGQPGDIAILSPACASFDLFKNYEDRGNQFKACVAEQIAKRNSY